MALDSDHSQNHTKSNGELRKLYQVFISSTFVDLKEERQLVRDALAAVHCIPTGMEIFAAGGDAQWKTIKKEIDRCDYYVVIIAGRYGTLADNKTSWTEKEFDYAVEQKKPVLPLIRGGIRTLPSDKREDDNILQQKLSDFRKRLEEMSPAYWDVTNELTVKCVASVESAKISHPSTGWVRADEKLQFDYDQLVQKQRGKIEELRKERDEKKHEISKLERRAGTSESAYRKLSSQRDEISAALTSAKEELSRNTSEMAALKKQASNREAKYDKAKNDLESERTAKAELFKRVDGLEQEVKVLVAQQKYPIPIWISASVGLFLSLIQTSLVQVLVDFKKWDQKEIDVIVSGVFSVLAMLGCSRRVGFGGALLIGSAFPVSNWLFFSTTWLPSWDPFERGLLSSLVWLVFAVIVLACSLRKQALEAFFLLLVSPLWVGLFALIGKFVVSVTLGILSSYLGTKFLSLDRVFVYGLWSIIFGYFFWVMYECEPSTSEAIPTQLPGRSRRRNNSK
ncbi:MAG: DUF4062 domain-containing protein [Planctomycetota bacterium]